jgi:signal transduction histidine kinase
VSAQTAGAVELGLLLIAAAIGAALALAGVIVWSRRRGQREVAALRQALATSAALCWNADAHGLIVSVEPGHRALPFDPKSLLQRALADLGTDDAARTHLAQAVASRLVFTDVRAALADCAFELSGAPVYGERGQLHGYAGIAREAAASEMPNGDSDTLMAELDARNRQLAERTRELQHAAGELDSLAHSVSHDLRAPLRIVDGFATIVLEDYGDRGKALDEVGRDHLRRIVAASQRMNTMIDTLLNLSRMTSRELTRERVDLSQIARELADDLRAQDAGRSVEFAIASGVKTAGDATLLRLVLQNLLGNAYKFTAKQREARIEFGCRREADGEVFFVKDNGAGFDMRFAEKMFGLFQRLHSANEFPGTGVGLATVQKIIRRHGGRVWAEAIPAPAEGHGATFYFTLWEKT